jgi:hypothetical protein
VSRAPKPLPVDPDRLRLRFPELSETDLEAYVAVTRRVLLDPVTKGRVLREVMDAARAARSKEESGGALTREESLALRYLRAVEKMQASTAAD